MNQFAELLNQPVANIGLFSALFNFVLCVGMGLVLRVFYMRWSYSLTGKTHIGAVLPILAAVVFLVITIVKSSLALSLGLVGALSIVRFRTPIKEPEELIYLFIAISLGLGYGAGQTMITTVIVTLIMLFVYFFLSNRKQNELLEYNMVLGWDAEATNVNELVDVVSPHVSSIKLLRLERGEQKNSAVLAVTPKSHAELDQLYNKLEEVFGGITVSFYESQNA